MADTIKDKVSYAGHAIADTAKNVRMHWLSHNGKLAPQSGSARVRPILGGVARPFSAPWEDKNMKRKNKYKNALALSVSCRMIQPSDD